MEVLYRLYNNSVFIVLILTKYKFFMLSSSQQKNNNVQSIYTFVYQNP